MRYGVLYGRGMAPWSAHLCAASPALQLLSETLVVLVCVLFVGCAVGLSLFDITEHRLPNRIVYPWAGVTAGLLLFISVVAGEPGAFGRSVLSGIVWGAALAMTRLIRPPPLGMGDVKLAVVLGMHAGYAGWSVLGGAVVLSFLFGGAASVVLLLSGRASRRARIPFGPFLLAGTACAIGLCWGS